MLDSTIMTLIPVNNEAVVDGANGDALPAGVPRPSGGDYTGFPLPEGMSLSFWLQSVRQDPLLDTRTTENLPDTAEVVIIGSGVRIFFLAKPLCCSLYTARIHPSPTFDYSTMYDVCN